MLCCVMLCYVVLRWRPWRWWRRWWWRRRRWWWYDDDEEDDDDDDDDDVDDDDDDDDEDDGGCHGGDNNDDDDDDDVDADDDSRKECVSIDEVNNDDNRTRSSDKQTENSPSVNLFSCLPFLCKYPSEHVWIDRVFKLLLFKWIFWTDFGRNNSLSKKNHFIW